MINPTGYTALDLIGFTDRGDYVNNANYVKNDLVSYLGSIWRCLVDDTTGIAPIEGVNWTLFMAQPSSNVEQIIAPVEQATATEAIAIGDQFIYNDILYEATAAISQGGNIIIPPNAGANCKVSDTLVKQIKTIKSSLGTAAAKDVPSSGDASNAQVVLGNDTRLSNSRTPTAHASAATTYGAGNASNFGHVKLSDTYNSNVGAAANSIGASQSALYNAYNFLYSVIDISNTLTKINNYVSNWAWLYCFRCGRFLYISVGITPKAAASYGTYKIATLPMSVLVTDVFFYTDFRKYGIMDAENDALNIMTRDDAMVDNDFIRVSLLCVIA